MREYAVGDEPVPGYQIIRPLGAGGYGTVWVARSPGDVEIALKIINLQGQGLKEFRAIGIVKRLRHPNLIPIYAYWLKDEFGNFLDSSAQDSVNLRGKSSELIIAMGLGDKSLAQRLDECKAAFAQRHGLPDTENSLIARLQELGGSDMAGLPIEELLEYMFGSARAIDYLNQPTHSLGTGPPSAIQHCDIKPGNLLIVSNDVQVCDYGLARVTGDARKTQAAGTPAYMAPELIAGKPSSGTDQYSLAITYYELRTGKLPFDESLAFHAHITGQLDFGLATPTEQEILRRATHTRPDQRYPHTIEVVRALREAVTPTRQPTPLSTPIVAPSGPAIVPAPAAPSSSSGVYRSGSAPVVPNTSTPTIVTKPTVLDDLIRAGIELVPGHRLDQLLGRGGYGEVWAATMPGKTRCALKIVRNLDAIQGKQEFKSLDMIRDLDHDRLIRLQAYWLLAYDGSVIPDDQIGQPGAPKASGLVVATDLAQQNLLQRWQECYDQGQAGIPKEELVPYMHQSAEAIDYLNFLEPAIVHRDIKPENILLTKNRQVKVSDFGLAKLVEGTSAAIGSASVGMTLAYAAPEMFRNQVTRWTDQYSLALTYYRLRVGRLPFEDGMGPIQMMQAHASGALDFTGVGEAEQAVLKHACAVEPEARFGSCVEFAETLATAVGLSRPNISTPAVAHSHPVSSAAVGTGTRWPSEPVRQPAASRGEMTARFPAPSDSGSNIRETLRFEDMKTPAVVPPGWPQPAPATHQGSSSGEFHLPDQRRVDSHGLPPGIMETTTNIPSASDLDTAPDGSRQDWRAAQTAGPRASGGGKKIAIIAAVAAVVVAGGIGGYVVMTRNPAGGGGGGGGNGGGGSAIGPTLAERQQKITADVEAKVRENAFADAARLVSDVSAKEPEKAAWQAWAVEQNAMILPLWRKAAVAKEPLQARAEELKRIRETFPNDEDTREQIVKVDQEIEAQQSRAGDQRLNAAFGTALALLKERKYKACTDALVKVEDMKPGDGLLRQVKEVRDAAADLDRRTAEGATEKLVGELALKVDAAPSTGDSDYKSAIREAYRRTLADKIEQVIPKLGATTKWSDLLAACQAAMPMASGSIPAGPANPWAMACRAECSMELLRRGQRGNGIETRVDLPVSAGTAPPLAAYFLYVSASHQVAASGGSAKDAIQTLAALAPERGDPPVGYLNDYRRRHVLDDLRSAAGKLKGTEALTPYPSGAADASKWLAAAVRLAEKDSANPNGGDRLRLKFDLALAYLAEQPTEADKARPLLDELVPEAAQKIWQPSEQETVSVWIAFARARDATAIGRRAAIQAYGRVFETLRNDLSGVRADYLYREIVQRLDAGEGKSILGEKLDDVTKPDAARLYFLAARNVRRYADAWSELADLGQPAERERERLRLVVRLLKRSAQLDPKPEYAAWAGIADMELPGGGGDAAATLPATTGAVAPALYLLRGIALITQADKVPDLAVRLLKWREADTQFRTGLDQCGSRPEFRDEKVLLYQRAANNCIQLANDLEKTSPGEMRRFLDDAKGFADKLLQLDPGRMDGYDTLGCALEDMAWLRKDADRFTKNGKYAQAIEAFSKVTNDLGARATPWMHRGRCRFKWADDAQAQPGSTGFDGGLVAAASADLDKVLDLSPDTVEATEAHYWKARLALLGRTAAQTNPGGQYALAAGEFQRAADLAKAYSAAWHETALLEWAVAAYGEADRLAPARNQPARDALTDALARADAVKMFSPPWATLLTMKLMTEVQRKLEPTKDRIPDAVAVSLDGLKPDCRAQDKSIQFMIRMLLVDYRTSILRAYLQHKDGAKALADAEAGMTLVKDKNARLTSADEAQAHGAKGIAYYVIYETSTKEEDKQQSRTEFAEAVRIDADHPASWKWKSYLAVYLGKEKSTGRTEAEILASEATRLATGYRLCREAEITLEAKDKGPGVTTEEREFYGYIGRQRATFVDPGFPRWVQQIDQQKEHPDRHLWLLAAAEKMVLIREEPKKAQQYLDEAKKIVLGLTEDQQEASRRQVERVEVLWLLPAVEAQVKDDLAKAKAYLDEAKKIVASMPEGQRWAYRGQVSRVSAVWLLAAAEKYASSKTDRKQAQEYLDDAQKIVGGLPEAQRDAFRQQIDRIGKLLKLSQ
jgi:serine/threonine protein kinase